jgi:hypothetical protein
MKSDRVLVDARKAIVPDAKHTIAIESGEGLLEKAVRAISERKEREARKEQDKGLNENLRK